MKVRWTKKKVILLAGAAVLLVLCIAALWHGLTLRRYTEQSDKVTSPVRLALLTDLHSTRYGTEQAELIGALRAESPDAILLAGDIADDEVPHEAAWELLRVIAREYPCYYVTGNHEFWSDEADAIKETIRSFGVTVLEGDTELIELRGQTLQICGVDDPDGFSDEGSPPEGWLAQFRAVCAARREEVYSVLLSHRPELMEYYAESGFDLVVSGHAHGGQVRLPWILNGLFAPNQGFFPQYAGGRYDLGDTSMIVSRGLSISRLPRVFNPPELVIVEIEPARAR